MSLSPRNRTPLPASILAVLGTGMLLATGPARAAVEIVAESFGGPPGDNLRGSSAGVFAPGIADADGSAVWVAPTTGEFKANGTVAAGAPSSAHLNLGSYLNDTKGQNHGLFELSVTISPTTGAWLSIGFSSSNSPSTNSTFTAAGGLGTMVYRANGDIDMWAGPGNTNEVAADDVLSSENRTLTITLDLRDYNGSSNFGSVTFRDSELGILGTRNFTAAHNFNSILLSTASSSGSYNNLTLTQITAPSITLPDRNDANPVNFSFEIENTWLTGDLAVSAAGFTSADAAYFSVLRDLSTPLVIPPGTSAPLELRFDPAGEFRSFLAGLWISTNDPDQPLLTVRVSARTIPPPPRLPLRVPLLLVHGHPDDESIFAGGVLPYYSQVRNLPVAVLCMVTRNASGSSPLTAGGASRIAELRRAMDVYAGQAPGSGVLNGSDYLTGNLVLAEAGLIDTGCCSVPPNDSWSDSSDGDSWGSSSGVTQLTQGFGNLEGIAEARLAAARAVARQIRRFRPDVVATCHDLEGEYGHSNHTATAIACIDALAMAADPATDIDGLAPWQSKKLYLRGGPYDNRDTITYAFDHPTFPSAFVSHGGIQPLFHDFFEEPAIGGQTPRQVADAGLAQHASQASWNFTVHTVFDTNGRYYGNHLEWWTLYESNTSPDPILPAFAVTADTTATTHAGWARGDFFANLTVFADRNFNGLADDWEIAHFGSLDAADPDTDNDGDGRNNLAEFIAGTDPRRSDALPLAFSADAATVIFTVPAATGPGYDGLTRHWRLLHSPDLEDWSSVVAEGTATGNPVNIPATLESRGFYRLKLELR